MNQPQICPECGASWSGGQTCADHFHTLLGWEYDYLLWDVHHLLVLGYHLQHPSLYSPQTLSDGQRMLVQFIEAGIHPDTMRRQLQSSVGSDKRQHKITGTPEAHGSYSHPIIWTMTIDEVVSAGMDAYYATIDRWARAILADLRRSNIIPD